jgi:hypothetical protein
LIIWTFISLSINKHICPPLTFASRNIHKRFWAWYSSNHEVLQLSYLQATWSPFNIEHSFFCSIVNCTRCGMNMYLNECYWSSIPLHGFAQFITLGFTCSSALLLVLRWQASCLPFTLAWFIATESRLIFTVMPCNVTLYPASSISLHHWFVHQIKVFISHFFMLIIKSFDASSHDSVYYHQLFQLALSSITKTHH